MPRGDGDGTERAEPIFPNCDLVLATEGGKTGLNCGTGGITFGFLFG